MNNIAEEPNSQTVATQAKSRGAYAHVLDGGDHPDKLSTLDAIATALSFPEWFGRNLDALYDCLTDLSWLPAGEHVLIWVVPAALKDTDPKAYLAIHSVLSDAQRALATPGAADGRRLTVVLTDS